MNAAVPPAPPDFRLDSLASFEGAADSRPFVLTGDRAAVVGRETSGIRDVLLHPLRAISGLQIGLPPADRIRIAAGALRRRLSAGGARMTESVLVFRRLPGVVVRWSRSEGSGAGRPFQLSLAWECPGGCRPEGAAEPTEESALRLSLADRDEELLFVLLGGRGRWRLRERTADGDPGLRVGLRAYLAPRSPLALAATVVREGGTEAAAVRSRLERLETEVEARANAERREEQEGPVLEDGDMELGRALAWARRRLPGSVVHPGGHRPGRVVAGYGRGCGGGRLSIGAPGGSDRSGPTGTAWIGHGLLAAGRHAEARDVVITALERLGGSGTSPGAAEEAVATADAALLAHLAARYALWSGDSGPLLGRQETVLATLQRVREGVADDASPAALMTAAAAHRDVADALEAGDRPDLAGDLRPGWEALRERLERWTGEEEGAAPRPTSGSPGPVRLPVVTGPSAGEGPHPDGSFVASSGAAGGGGGPRPVSVERLDPGVLAAVLDVPGPAPTAPGAGGDETPDLETGLWAWAAWERGNPAAALEAWRSVLVPGLEERRGLWGRDGGPGKRPDACPWHSATTALAVAPLVFGLLGGRADATYGRLRLAPRVPAGWDRFQIRGIRVGDVRVHLGYRREGERHTFVLAPTAGRVPLNAVFEPLLPAAAVGRIRVDGEEADVDSYRRRDRAGVRLQLPLDSRREITVDGADEHG